MKVPNTAVISCVNNIHLGTEYLWKIPDAFNRRLSLVIGYFSNIRINFTKSNLLYCVNNLKYQLFKVTLSTNQVKMQQLSKCLILRYISVFNHLKIPYISNKKVCSNYKINHSSKICIQFNFLFCLTTTGEKTKQLPILIFSKPS